MKLYIDDLVIKSVKEDNHPRDMKQVLQRCQKFNLELNPLKCAFVVTREKFLGFIVKHGVR